MRERMFATLGIWAALAFATKRILDSLSYTVSSVPETINESMPMLMEYSTQFVSGEMQVATYFIMFILIIAAMGATIAIWQGGAEAAKQEQAAASARESGKVKRDRQMRVRRLLSAMDEDELAALEQQHLNEDEMTVAQLIQQKQQRKG
jgi:hypothetical protein